MLCSLPLQSLSVPLLFCVRFRTTEALAKLICSAGFTPRIVVTHWFTTPTSTFSLSTWFLPFSYPALLEKSQKTPLLNLILPQSRTSGLARNNPPSHESDSSPPGPFLMGSIPLQRIQSRCPLHAALPQPLRSARAVFTRPRRFTPPLPIPKSPSETTHGVLSLQGSSRTGRPNSLLSKTTLMVLVGVCPLSAGDESLDTNSPPGSYDLVRPLPPALGFPSRRGPHPHGYYFLRPTAQPPGFPLGATLVVPLHSPNCERATAFK